MQPGMAAGYWEKNRAATRTNGDLYQEKRGKIIYSGIIMAYGTLTFQQELVRA